MKAQERFIVIISFACFVSAMFIGGLGILLVSNDGAISIVKSTLAGIKLCIGAVCAQCLFLCLLNWRCKPVDSSSKNQLRVSQVLCHL